MANGLVEGGIARFDRIARRVRAVDGSLPKACWGHRLFGGAVTL